MHPHRFLAAAAAGVSLALGPALAFAAEPPGWMTYDASAKRVKMTIVSGKDTTNGGWNFNGYASGALTITVPAGWNVEIDFRNADQLQHSLVVISGDGPLPPQGGDPAFPRAYTVDLVPGIPQGRGDRVPFVADEPGKYRIFCGVIGHGVAGMWDWFVVSADAQAPSATTTTTTGAK